MNQERVAAELFSECKRLIPSAGVIATAAIDNALQALGGDLHKIKQNFSLLVAEVQLDAYRRYQQSEAEAAASAMQKVMLPLLEGNQAEDVFAFLGENFGILDRFYLSLTQSRRSRAGIAFEAIMSRLLDVLSYPYTPQPELPGSRPDYVLPSMDWYNAYAADCIILTCKRTLRERWRQIVTEGSTGNNFYLATIDDRISAAELERMKDRKVVVVVPFTLKAGPYAHAHNVISFEDFFLHHLDPAMSRWKSTGAL